MKDFAMSTEFILKFVGEHEKVIIIIFTMIVIPFLKYFFKSPNFKSDLAEVRNIWDEKDKFDEYPNFIKDGFIKQISVLKFLDYRTFKILCNKELSYFDIMTINESLNYNSFYKFKYMYKKDDEVEFSLHNKGKFFTCTFEKPKAFTLFFLSLAVILLITFFYVLTLGIRPLNIIFFIILVLFEVVCINLKSNLDEAIRAKKILDSKKLFKYLQKN